MTVLLVSEEAVAMMQMAFSGNRKGYCYVYNVSVG